MRAAHRLRITAGARGEDQHEQVIGFGGTERHRRIVKAGCCRSPRGGFDVDRTRNGGVGAVVGQHQLAVGVGHVALQGCSPSGGVEPHRHQAGQCGRHQQCGEERGIAQQDTDVRRLVRVEPRVQCGAQPGAGRDVVAPADEIVLVVDAAVVDLGQRGQQSGDGGLFVDWSRC